MSPPARVVVFYTGGTISMTHTSTDGSAVPTLTGADICRVIPHSGQFDLTNIDFGQLPGPHMSPERALALCAEVNRACEEGCDGVVITHGTDTIEETAYLLDLLHTHSTPVVLVGAMRTRDDLSWDGPINLFAACLVAANKQSRSRGVMVVMNNTIHAASEVTKTYTEALDTFVSPDTGPLGIVDLNQVFFYRHPVRRQTLPRPPHWARVDLLEACAGSDGLLIDAADKVCAGLVVAAMGRGNVPPAMALALTASMGRGRTVVVVSRCWGGRVAPVYGYEGGGARLMDAGALFAPWLNGPKARIALGTALGAKLDRSTLSKFFSSDFVANVHRTP